MNILHQQNGSKGSFYIEENNQRLAEMTYTLAGEKRMIIDHTDVSDALRGKGAGKQLVNAAVDHARAKGIKILPLCPFARSVFDKVKEFQDVLDN
ncbi:MAG TPA: GNAT family N-acetyltransferase [Cyclobacteriaceae bacterium]|nr:GNAT family N-acetyltransferase [Cyclobacteriaceae bacterium]HRJ82265.1 GNAT family N-acetyltransferase [Cyclobacteriaceae bacterium]